MKKLGVSIAAISLIAVVSVVLVKRQQLFVEERDKVAQKIMLDLRYYCPEMTPQDLDPEKPCVTPLTQLPAELAQMISDNSLGSVILFADNLEDIGQIINLTGDLQSAALASKLGLPLFISIDQEGGRVVRLPRDIASSFTGNMSVGATYRRHGSKHATNVGRVIGRELSVLGFNVNHAPTVDVNINPENPVINVRSFSDEPTVVGKLGIAMLNGMQEHGVIATLKHFPGHGDTHVDSHTGLPVVNHDTQTLEQVDLLPFQLAIDQGNVEMIMTAHIQYPAIDDSTLVNKFGKRMVKPATLSRAILTDLLREKMGYQGIIITDALDMAGISAFFSPLEAVTQTFDAGADIAMMPMKIIMPAQIPVFEDFLSQVTRRIIASEQGIAELDASFERIDRLKQRLAGNPNLQQDVATKMRAARITLANDHHRLQESRLAMAAVVEIENKLTDLESDSAIKRVHIVFPTDMQSQAMANALRRHVRASDAVGWQVSHSSFADDDLTQLQNHIDDSQLLIVASDSQETAVERGGASDVPLLTLDEHNLADQALTTLSYAKEQGKKTIFVPLNMPYHLEDFKLQSDWILATFDGKAYLNQHTGLATSPAFDALSSIITGQTVAQGSLPIRL